MVYYLDTDFSCCILYSFHYVLYLLHIMFYVCHRSNQEVKTKGTSDGHALGTLWLMAPFITGTRSMVIYVSSRSWRDSRSLMPAISHRHGVFLAFGKHPSLLIDNEFPVGQNCKRRMSRQLLFSFQKTAHNNIQWAQKGYKTYFDKKHAAPDYAVGDMVLLNNAHQQQRKWDKLAQCWTGPFETEEI